MIRIKSFLLNSEMENIDVFTGLFWIYDSDHRLSDFFGISKQKGEFDF